MRAVLAIFERKADLVAAIRALQARGVAPLEAFAPVPDPELIQIASPGKSPVRVAALTGAIIGALSGLGLTIWTTAQWPLLITGGKPLISLPPFLIIAFELTILVGALGTVAGFLYAGVVAAPRDRVPSDPRFLEGHFGLAVHVAPADVEPITTLLTRTGAVECRVS